MANIIKHVKSDSEVFYFTEKMKDNGLFFIHRLDEHEDEEMKNDYLHAFVSTIDLVASQESQSVIYTLYNEGSYLSAIQVHMMVDYLASKYEETPEFYIFLESVSIMKSEEVNDYFNY